MKKTNWAIIAPGNIATKFATALQGVPTANCYSVASRTPEKAQAFADTYGFDTFANNYDALIRDPNVDAIYIASPHTLHADQSIACLNAGKAVLCEKPLAVNLRDAQSIVQAAKNNETFFMEAVWTRFLPVHKKIVEWVNNGLIGDVQTLHANFGINANYDPKHRLFNPDLAGGALLDLGIYPITMAQIVMGERPQSVCAVATLGQTKVDENVAALLHYEQGQIAIINASVRANTSCDAWIFGSKGRIHIPFFWHAESTTLYQDNGRTPTKVEQYHCQHRINGYEYEIEEVQRCIQHGISESPLLPWSESLSVIQIMDQVRADIKLKYTFETVS